MSTWILLRGLAREARHWGSFPETLERVLPSARVIALDLPGNGSLCRMRSPNRIGDMVEYARANLADRGVTPPYHLLGLSLGGMIAVEWSTRHPQEVAAAVLINSSLGRYCSVRQRLRFGSCLVLLSLLLSPRNPKEQEERILRLTSRRAGSDVRERWAAYAREHPVSRGNVLRQVVAAARYGGPEAAPPVSLLLLTSAADRLVAPACSRRLAEDWGVDLREHPDAGHDLPLDDASWVASRIGEWIAASTVGQSPDHRPGTLPGSDHTSR